MGTRRDTHFLQDLTLQIDAAERIGVCGRTGAGKSSLSVLLFHLVGEDCMEGKIHLDDLNVNGMGLHRLRQETKK